MSMKSCQAPLLLSETQYKIVPESYRCDKGLWILRFYYNENTTQIDNLQGQAQGQNVHSLLNLYTKLRSIEYSFINTKMEYSIEE